MVKLLITTIQCRPSGIRANASPENMTTSVVEFESKGAAEGARGSLLEANQNDNKLVVYVVERLY
jgi:hypothetical protein